MNSYNRTVMPNGLRLLTAPMVGVESATVLIMVGAGSRFEPKKINGISHFLEHMAFKGTKTRPSALDISSLIDGIGGEFNAFTSKDHTGYYIKAAKKHIPLLFDVLSDMLRNSILDKAEIEREKGVILEEINLYEDTPSRKIGDLIENVLYGDHPLGWDIAGLPENIQGITREDFIQYMDDYYVPSNIVVAVGGGIGEGTEFSQDKIEALATKHFGDWKDHSIKPFLPISDDQQKPVVHVLYKDSNQAHLSLAVRSYPIGHPKRYAMSLLSTILGGGMSSRLFIEVRERRGLAYYVRSGAEQYKDAGYFATTAGVDVKRITDAVRVIYEQYNGIVDRSLPITDHEVARAKEYIKGRLTLSLEDSQSVAGLYAGQELIEDHIRTPDEIITNLQKVTKDEIYDVAEEIFKGDKLTLAVIGPYKDDAPFKKALSIQ